MMDLSLAGWFRTNERRLARRLSQAVAGLVVVATAVANPAMVTATATATEPNGPALIVNRWPSTIFEGTDVRGREGAEASARLLVASLGGLPVARGEVGPWVRRGDLGVGVDRCPRADLVVSWTAPEGEYTDGAYIEPLGPPPTVSTDKVNGVVLCRSSRYAFLGFEAAWEDGRWLLAPVPSLDEETEDPLLEGEAAASGAAPAETAEDGDGRTSLPPATRWGETPLEPLALYVPQTTCDPIAKPGVLGFRDLLLASFPGSRNLGIGRVCDAPGVSEHKEGRAFDWGVNYDDPGERAAADQVLAWMLGPDDSGEPYAIARRLGLMYVIWDGRIWSSFLAEEGWRPYVGRSAHRDHIHFSFDWNGALAHSSFWQGGLAGLAPGSARPDLPLLPVTPPTTMLPLPPIPLPPLPAPPAPVLPPPPEPTPQHTPPPPPTTTTTTKPPPPPSTTTTSTAPPSTTTTTAPVITEPTVVSPPTTIGLGSL